MLSLLLLFNVYYKFDVCQPFVQFLKKAAKEFNVNTFPKSQ